jgi:hypothetical protein
MAPTRQLWSESVRSRLGQEGYAWFLEKVNRHIANCTACGGMGTVTVERKDGAAVCSKLQNCYYCWVYVNRLEDFTFAYFHCVPAAYRKHILSLLQPYEGTQSVVSMERQQAILEMLRKEPEGGYVFFGPPHAGKTVWTTALYIQNLYRFYIGVKPGEPTDREKTKGKTAVWRIKAKTLLDQHTEWSIKRSDKDEYGDYTAPEPDVTAEKIHRFRILGVRSKLYLEEIDKVNMTDARTNNLFEVIDALHEEEGVIVINSNLRPDEFTARFGEQFTWRLAERSKVINLFEK